MQTFIYRMGKQRSPTYSMGNYVSILGYTIMENNIKINNVYINICIIESLCYTAGINTAL